MRNTTSRGLNVLSHNRPRQIPDRLSCDFFPFRRERDNRDLASPSVAFQILQTSSPHFRSMRWRMMKDCFSLARFLEPAAPSGTVEVLKPALRRFRARRSTTSRSSLMVRTVFLDAASMEFAFIAETFRSPRTFRQLDFMGSVARCKKETDELAIFFFPCPGEIFCSRKGEKSCLVVNSGPVCGSPWGRGLRVCFMVMGVGRPRWCHVRFSLECSFFELCPRACLE